MTSPLEFADLAMVAQVILSPALSRKPVAAQEPKYYLLLLLQWFSNQLFFAFGFGDHYPSEFFPHIPRSTNPFNYLRQLRKNC